MDVFCRVCGVRWDRNYSYGRGFFIWFWWLECGFMFCNVNKIGLLLLKVRWLVDVILNEVLLVEWMLFFFIEEVV